MSTASSSSSFAVLKAKKQARQAGRFYSSAISLGGSDGNEHIDDSADIATSNSDNIIIQEDPPEATPSNSIAKDIGHALESNGIIQDDGSSSKSQKHDVDESSETENKLFGSELGDHVQVRQIRGRGRGLVVKKKFETGSRIITTKPISTLSLNHLTTICSGCFLTIEEKDILSSSTSSNTPSGSGTGSSNTKRKGKGLNRCSSCKTLHYCSRECQISDWELHQHECKALKRMRGMYFSAYPEREKDSDSNGDLRWAGHEAVRALGRICWARKKYGEVWLSQIKIMESHVDQLPESEVMQLGQQVQHLLHYLAASHPVQSGQEENVIHPANMDEYGFESSKELLDLCSAFKVNSFTLSSPSLSPIGVSTSPLVALANHSCDPNAVVVFPNGGGIMEVIAIKPIIEREEILTSYIDISTPVTERQSELLSRYRFTCDCALCTDDEKGFGTGRVDPRWCVRHVGCKKGKGGKGPMPDAKNRTKSSMCDACNESFDVNIDTIDNLIKKGNGILALDESGQLDPENARTTLSSLIPLLLTHIPPSSHPVLALLRLHALVLSPPRTISELHLATSQLALAYTGAQVVYPTYHPTLAIILAEWGKLLSLDLTSFPDAEVGIDRDLSSGKRVEAKKRLEMAITILKRATIAAQKSFGGDGGIVGLEMMGLVKACQGEWALL